ncbi:MurR/RpiR family transcriptional regulator [Selenomonas sp.]|uniref:MurR/RpiR family transcriptional regulator n=1 Tax=Selenomonas sp. TaxID=2053611 RepID=UPI0025D9B257|nr:MurR/RpiR family transcriptional regulator [Selenomonas sp.]MCI6284339.1 MurR/RpiR family transcriptional regulator [Selenomonas sp.]
MLIRIDQDFHEHLTDTEKAVISFLNSNVDKISTMSISDVAEQTFSSPATVSRTIKKCGISGFAELRYLISKESKEERDDVSVNEIFNKSMLEVSNTIDHLSIETILAAVKEIRSANRVYLLSRGLSELVIIYSLSGKTPELLKAAENAASLGARIITITCGGPNAPLARIAHLAVFVYKHSHVSIKSVDATSRLPLYVISRILIDYITKQMSEEEEKAERAKEAKRKARYF